MKTRIVCTLVAALLIAGRADAGVDKARLRELAELPNDGFSMQIGFSTLYGFYFGKSPDPLVEIERLQKQMKGDASDIERYQRLGRLYTSLKRKEEAREVRARVLSLCRQQVREQPENRVFRIQLGDALASAGKIEEGEKLLRQIVEEAPQEWRAWLALAECVDGRAMRAIFGERNFSFHFDDASFKAPALAERKPTEEQIAEMRRLQKEARGYFDRAIALAPRESKPYSRRLASRGASSMLQAALRTIQGERFNPMDLFFFSPECLPDMRQVARFSPDDPQAIGPEIVHEIFLCAYHGKIKTKKNHSSSADSSPAKDRSALDALPEENRQAVRWGMERLEKLTRSPDKATAAAASEYLGVILLMTKTMGDELGVSTPTPANKEDTTAKIVEHLRRAVRLDPSRERAWDVLTGVFLEKKAIGEAIPLARQRIAIKDNAWNRFLLAKLYEGNKQFDKAAEQLQAGFMDDPNDLDCSLGLIALALKRGDDPSLQEADWRFKSIAPAMRKEKSKERFATYLTLLGIRDGLRDNPVWAKKTFLRVLQEVKPQAKPLEALAALGEPLGSAVEEAMIDYLQKRHGRIERADGQPISPVERIDLNGRSIKDENLFALMAFPQLHELNLSRTSITDAGLTRLTSLTDLHELDLSQTKITDAGLTRLSELKKLRQLRLGSTHVTPQGIAELRKALPRLKVSR